MASILLSLKQRPYSHHQTHTRRTCMGKGNLTLTPLLLTLAAVLCLPGEALALQVHGEPEGLYVHQMAHIHYLLALGYFYWDIRRTAFTGRGWRYLQLYCILMAAWNIVAFSGHAVGVSLDPQELLQHNGYLQTILKSPIDLHKFSYFITKLDHLLCVPALFFLFIGMRSFYHSVAGTQGKRGDE